MSVLMVRNLFKTGQTLKRGPALFRTVSYLQKPKSSFDDDVITKCFNKSDIKNISAAMKYVPIL